MNIETMRNIQEMKAREIAEATALPLDAEGQALARQKRDSFDMPINVAKVDPLR